jgi:peptidoglycan-associated lipoprotein
MSHGTLTITKLVLISIFLLSMASACAKKQQPVEPRITPSLPLPTETPSLPPRRPTPTTVPEPIMPPLELLKEKQIESATLEALNRDSPLEPIFFAYDSSEISSEAQVILKQNVELLTTYRPWTITIEGHCDERGTAEYNLALGERRALAAQSYLVSLGIEAARIMAVSYGKEFPFESGQDEQSWTENRRAHFIVTAK